jgi:hypothetical protein
MTLVRRAPRPADVVILPGRIGPDDEARPAFDCPPQTTHAEIERALDVLAERAVRRLDWDRLRGAASAAEVAGAIERAVKGVDLSANGIDVPVPYLHGACDPAAQSAVAASLYRRLRPADHRWPRAAAGVRGTADATPVRAALRLGLRLVYSLK